jgi:hypothetical protein
VGLWRDLALDRSSQAADEARRFGATQYDVRDRLLRLGPAVVPLLIDLIEQNVLAPAFNEEGSEARKRLGAFTLELSLASAAASRITECNSVSDAEVERLQRILGMRVAADAELAMASTLAENIARVLRHLRPKRFPESELDPHTNHLRNPEPVLAEQSKRLD